MKILDSDIKSMNNPADAAIGRGVFLSHYIEEESKPHIKIEKLRLLKLQEVAEDGRHVQHNPFNIRALMKRCGYTFNKYSCAQKGHRGYYYLDMMFQLAMELDSSIDYILNKNRKVDDGSVGEIDLILKLNKMDLDQRNVCLSVWSLFGIDRLRSMLND